MTERQMNSCGEVMVYVGGFALRARCEEGRIVDTFVKGYPCPFHPITESDMEALTNE